MDISGLIGRSVTINDKSYMVVGGYAGTDSRGFLVARLIVRNGEGELKDFDVSEARVP